MSWIQNDGAFSTFICCIKYEAQILGNRARKTVYGYEHMIELAKVESS